MSCMRVSNVLSAVSRQRIKADGQQSLYDFQLLPRRLAAGFVYAEGLACCHG